MRKLLIPFLAAVALPTAVNANSYVNDNLNAADGMFNAGMDGCTSVSGAILAANNPQIYGPTSSSLKAELKTYAQRCNLRY
tara:strand:+ start:101 stop:343 length:243 start_codon:yes stop_codon:yes gene_type:complete